MSAKGTTWKKHKYVMKINGVYYYEKQAKAYEKKIKNKTKSFEDSIKTQAKEFEEKLNSQQEVKEKVKMDITLPNVKLDKENIQKGLTLFKDLTKKYWNFSYRVGKFINEIIRK